MSWNVVPNTDYIPLQIADIARAQGISIEEAGHVKAAFEIAFADPGQRGRIYEMMDELDRQAAEKGEPDGLKVCFGVDLDKEGYTVMRNADLLQPGENALAAGKAEVYCRIRGNFPNGNWLGPLVLKRPAANVKSKAEDEAGSGVRMVHSVEEALEVLEQGGYWPIFFGGLRRYLAPKLNESRGSALLRRAVERICTEVLSVLFGRINFLPKAPIHPQERPRRRASENADTPARKLSFADNRQGERPWTWIFDNLVGGLPLDVQLPSLRRRGGSRFG